MSKPIPQYEPFFLWGEADAVGAYMRNGGWVTEHTETRKFEAELARYTGAKHCVVTTSGTMALMLAAIALRIGPEDEVIVPAYTMVATANAFAALGARVKFVDVEPDTLCLDAALVEKAVTHQTRAIVLVSANGRQPRQGNIISNIAFIEDACQSLGSFYKEGMHAGRLGQVGCFSFSPHKIVSTGQGGALITDDDELAQKLRRAKDFGRDSGGGDIHPHFGVNGKFTDLQAVVGLEQMKGINSRVEHKRLLWRWYMERLAHLPDVQTFDLMRDSTPWFIDIRCQRRDELAGFLKAKGIGTRKMYPPIPSQPCWATEENICFEPGSFPVAEEIGRTGLWLPSSLNLTERDVHFICGAIYAFYKGTDR
jgi:perosamine synthetase